jgi:hypothetical protein
MLTLTEIQWQCPGSLSDTEATTSRILTLTPSSYLEKIAQPRDIAVIQSPCDSSPARIQSWKRTIHSLFDSSM